MIGQGSAKIRLAVAFGLFGPAFGPTTGHPRNPIVTSGPGGTPVLTVDQD